jgi:hypothetical protein
VGYLRYYQMAGDPGFFSSLKKIAGKVGGLVGKVGKIPLVGPLLKAVPGVGTAISIGGIAAGALGIINKQRAGKGASPIGPPGFLDPFGQYGGTPGQSIGGGPATTGYGPAAGGYGYGGRRRRINPTNPRALRRAISRVKSFRKLSHRVEMLLPKRRASSPRSFGRKR